MTLTCTIPGGSAVPSKLLPPPACLREPWRGCRQDPSVLPHPTSSSANSWHPPPPSSLFPVGFRLHLALSHHFHLAAASCVALTLDPSARLTCSRLPHSSFPMHVWTLVSSLASALHRTNPRRPLSLRGKWVWEARAVTSPESVTSPCLRISAGRTMALWFLQSPAFWGQEAGSSPASTPTLSSVI